MIVVKSAIRPERDGVKRDPGMSQSHIGEPPQTVFVVMPFKAQFDDVYATIRDSVAKVDQ